MGDKPATENRAATIVNKVLEKAIDLGMRAAKGAAVAAAPWIGWPVISQLTDFFLAQIGKFFYKFLAEHATFIVIDFQTEAEKKAYLESVDRLKLAQQAGDEHAIQEARDKFKSDLARLIHWDGHATP